MATATGPFCQMQDNGKPVKGHASPCIMNWRKIWSSHR